jgi:hypothetical protein
VLNSLPVNARLGARYRLHADIDIDERCKNCYDAGQQLAGQRETFYHLFWECNYANKILTRFGTENFPALGTEEIKRVIFLGIRENDFCRSTRILTLLFLFEIWRNRFRSQSSMSYATIEFNVFHTLDKIFQANKNFKKHLAINTIFFF